VKKILSRPFLSLVLAASLLSPCAAVAGRAPRHRADLQNPSSQAEREREPQDEVKTFTGTIAKSHGNFVLQESTVGGTYGLDDQKTASNYEGKKVVVTGTYDSDSKMIHIQKIEELA
jgi:hypothetical protein